MSLALSKRIISDLICQRGKSRLWYRTLTSAVHKVNYQRNSSVLGYSIKEVANIPELNILAVLLEHPSTGAEHLHLACDDSNNFFGVSFRTPPSDDTGVSHILEHLSLCGSRRYPCRDPFFNMLNRSLSTFMNAFTGADNTIYVFSSQNQKDFENLMSVYLDATFYPSLLETDFRQEGWRLEHETVNDPKSPIVFKGVVFNEMKGVFSDPSQFYARNLQNHLFPSNAYSHESGGDPLKIPQLKWEDLRRFHSQFYHPSNSKFFTYGNMPLERHLERIQTLVLDNFKKIDISSEVSEVVRWNKPKESTFYNRFDPMAHPDKQVVVSESYVLNRIMDTRENFALSILGTLLVDGPNSPFYQKLLLSGIGPDYSPCSGFDASLKQSVFSIGLREISEKDIEAVKGLISETFDNVIKNGFPEEQINSVLHCVELGTKHRTSNFGLNCAMGIASLWNHNGNPISAFKVNEHVQWFLKQLQEKSHFLQDKVVEYFKNNNHRLTLIMKPDQNWEKELQLKENEILQSRLSKLGDREKLEVFNEGLELAEHQEHNDVSCLPTLKIEDVKKTVDRIPLSFFKIDGVPVQLCETPTNELVYFNALVDVSDISDEDTLLLPLFSSIITQMGAGNLDYKAFDQEMQLKTSGLHASLHLPDHPSDPEICNRTILFSSYCLEKNVEDMFSLWRKLFTEVRLEDEQRLSQLIRLRAAELAQGLTHRGHAYAMRTASSCLTSSAQLKEKLFGLTQILYMKQLSETEDHKEVLLKMKKLAEILLKRKPLRCSLNATPQFMPSAVNSLKTLIDGLIIEPSTVGNPKEKADFTAQSLQTHFVLPLAVNHMGRCIMTVPYSHPDFARLRVAAKMMSSKYLHSEIREKGGAYGGGASIGMGGHFSFYSYRDPNLEKTLDSFSSAIQWVLDGSFTGRDLLEAKLGVFSEVDAPIPPGSRGQRLFEYEISDEMLEQMRKQIFECTEEDVKTVVHRYLKNCSSVGTALIGPRRTGAVSNSWKVIETTL